MKRMMYHEDYRFTYEDIILPSILCIQIHISSLLNPPPRSSHLDCSPNFCIKQYPDLSYLYLLSVHSRPHNSRCIPSGRLKLASVFLDFFWQKIKSFRVGYGVKWITGQGLNCVDGKMMHTLFLFSLNKESLVTTSFSGVSKSRISRTSPEAAILTNQ